MKKDSIWKTKIGLFLAACLAVGNGQAQSTFTQVTTGPATIYYLPNATGWSNTFAGHPTALWAPQVLTGDGSFGVQSNRFGFNFSWASGQTVVAEACTNLSNPVWIPMATNTLASNTSYFSDPAWANYLARFYRLKQQ